MVLPDRIELSTSPLPMECSTTELRQHAPDTRIGPSGAPTERADPCHKAPFRASAGGGRKASKTASPGSAATCFSRLWPDPVPHIPAERLAAFFAARPRRHLFRQGPRSSVYSPYGFEATRRVHD